MKDKVKSCNLGQLYQIMAIEPSVVLVDGSLVELSDRPGYIVVDGEEMPIGIFEQSHGSYYPLWREYRWHIVVPARRRREGAV